MEPWAPIGFIISAALLLLAGWVWALDICIYGPPSACKEKRKKAKRKKGENPFFTNLVAATKDFGKRLPPKAEYWKVKEQKRFNQEVEREKKKFTWLSDESDKISICYADDISVGHLSKSIGTFRFVARSNFWFGITPTKLVALGLFLKNLPKSQRRT